MISLLFLKKIEDRYNDEIPDKPLFLEWNVWRGLSLLDDGEVRGNFKVDIDGMPLSTAPGNMPDIECYYENFVLAVEVTLSTGQRQYETEGEPVPRHLGNIVKKLREQGDKRPVYGLFVAGNLNAAIIAYFFVISRLSVEYYGGKAKIIPLNIKNFVEMLKHAKEKGGITSGEICKFIERADPEEIKAKTEREWIESVKNCVCNWTAAS